MMHKLLLCCALAAPLSVRAAPPKAPEKLVLTIPKDSDENWELAKSLMKECLAPMRASRTYSGAMTMSMKIGPKEKQQEQEMRARTSWRSDDQGDKAGETLMLDGSITREGKKVAQSLRAVDNGRERFVSYSQPRVWSRAGHEPNTFFVKMLGQITDLVTGAVEESVFLTPKVKAGVEGGVPVYLVRDEEGDTDAGFTMVLDGRTKALRSLTFFVPEARIEVKLFDQQFDKPLAPEAFVWKAPEGSREAKPGEVAMNLSAFVMQRDNEAKAKAEGK